MDAGQKRGELGGSIALAQSDDKDILALIKGGPGAIVFKDMHINKRAMDKMREFDIALCLPISFITCSYGLQRSRSIYLMSRLFAHARSIKLEVSFATLAMNNMHLCSYIQLMELARLLGAEEEYARRSISEINGSLVEQ